MNSLVTTVSGYFSKSLILGAFLPTVIFIAFFVLLVSPRIPSDIEIVKQLQALETEWKIVSMTFATVVLSGLLYNLNTPHIRLYEGYPWKDTWFGKWMVARKKKKFRNMDARQRGLRTLLRLMNRTDEDSKGPTMGRMENFLSSVPHYVKRHVPAGTEVASSRWDACYSTLLGEWVAFRRRFLNEFPSAERLVLPTRCGNVIRSFEYYPDREYGIDAIAMFPRLISQIDKEHRDLMDEAKTSFDFMINCASLGAILGFSLAAVGIATNGPFESSRAFAVWIIQIIVILFISYLAYEGAINRAAVWGETVKAAFDLYRGKLLMQLGYSQNPDSKIAERSLWDKISIQMLDGDSLKGPRIAYQENRPSTYISCKPENADVRISRGIGRSNGRNIYQVVIRVSNSGKTEIENVVLTDSLPDGWHYHIGSPEHRIDNDPSPDGVVAVEGTNPIHFAMGQLKAAQSKTLKYEIVCLTCHAGKDP